MGAELLITIGIVVLIHAIKRKGKWTAARTPAPVEQSHPYKLRPSILTPTELDFYHVLRQATPATICIKPRIADVLDTPRRDYTAFAKVSQKHCDFVLCEPATMRPILAVELDDYTHNRPDRQARDEFVNQAYHAARLPILHIRVSHNYDLLHLRDTITHASWQYHTTPHTAPPN